MDKELHKSATDILAIIANSSRFSENRDFHELFLDAESLISGMAFLIGPVRDLEQKYRQEIVGYMSEGDSHAKAETKAKAGDTYKQYRKLEDVVELAKEQVMLLKKFKGDLETEYKHAK
jgi:hypothetical protein